MKYLKKIGIFILTILTILSLFSCGVYNTKKDNSKQKETVYETTAAMASFTKNGFARSSAKLAAGADTTYEESIDSSVDRKIAKSVSLNAETKNFDSSIEWLKKYVSSFNGIIDNSYIDTGDVSAPNYKKNAHFAIRIPADTLDKFLGQIGDNLNVTFRQENIVDVTEDYFDSESRLNSLKIEEENLNEMLKKAKNVDEMIKVEDKLYEVRSNIENISRRIKSYDKQVNYSRVDINIFEVKDLTDIKIDNNDFSKETLNKKLKKTVEDVKLFLRNVAAYLFVNIPWIILGLIVILVEILLYMAIKALFFKKKDEDSNEENEDIKNDKSEQDDKKNKKSKDDKKDKVDEEEALDKAIEEVGKAMLEGSDMIGDDDINVDYLNGN